MDSSRLQEGLEFIQKHVIKRQKRTKNMPKSSQKDAKWGKGSQNGALGVQKWHQNDASGPKMDPRRTTSFFN